MSVSIQVNHRVLREVAAEINAYCDFQDREMHAAKTAISSMLAGDWRGLDAQEFSRQWAGVNDRDSTAVKFRESLRNYATSLSICADLYQSTQADVVNSAGLLMRLMG